MLERLKDLTTPSIKTERQAIELYSVRETEPTQKLPLSISLMNLLRHISQACSMLPI